MAFFDSTWYVNYGNGSTTGYYAVPVWPGALAAVTAGTWCRQSATPTVGNERCFVCVVAGTTGAAEPIWVVTRGADSAANIDGTVKWMECTGMAGPCGDLTNAPVWVASRAVTLGEVYYDSVSGSLQAATTGGTSKSGAAPSFSATAGVTTADNTVTWTSLGPTSNYTGGQYPHARMMNAAATNWAQVLSGVGNTIYMLSASAETQSTAITTPSNASVAASPFSIICVSGAHYPPQSGDVTTAASINTTGASSITDNLIAYRYGLTYSAGDAANSASIFFAVNAFNKFDTCTFKINNTNVASTIVQSTNSATLIGPILLNCNFIFGATGQSMLVFNNIGGMTIIGGAMAPSGPVPTTLFIPQVNHFFNVLLRDVDLSAITGTILNTSQWTQGAVKIQNCKLGAAVSITSGLPTSGPYDPSIHLANSDSSNTNYRYFFQDYGGTIQQETTIVRTGSLATDGTTPISWNMATTANIKFIAPFISEEIAIWNDTTGSTVTITLYLISNTTLNNNDFWAEAEYAGTSSFPLGLTVNSRMTLLGTPAALTSDTSTWGGSTNKYKIVLTCAPQNKGPIKVRFYAAKASATTYVDPYIYLS